MFLQQLSLSIEIFQTCLGNFPPETLDHTQGRELRGQGQRPLSQNQSTGRRHLGVLPWSVSKPPKILSHIKLLE